MPIGHRKDVEIQPSQTFHLPAAQEANKQNLIETLGAAEKTFTAIAKTKKETWREMGEGFSKMESFARMGGITSLLGGSISRVQDTITGMLDAMLAPIVTEFTSKLGEILTAFNEFTQKLDDVKLATYSTGEEVSLLDAAMKGLSAAMFGLFGLPQMLGDVFEALGEGYEMLGGTAPAGTAGSYQDVLENKIDAGL